MLRGKMNKKYNIYTFYAIISFFHVILTGKYALFKNIFVILPRQIKI